MKLLTDWGFNADWWRGQRGEYWVIAQVALLLIFTVLPVYRPSALNHLAIAPLSAIWGSSAGLGLASSLLLLTGLWNLGQNLTPLPYPKEQGELIQSGAYSWVRHPLYSGLILASLSWALFQMSLTHLLGALVFLVFFNAKASREETWLTQKYSDYTDYQHRVKKLIPWLY